jgi:hypothetical protein
VELHPDVRPLADLLGTWAGEGAGEYPMIEPFRYREELVLGHVGKPFLTWRQTTVNLTTGLPAHAEAGYLRTVGDNRVELVLAHPTGLAEVATGATEPTAGGLRLHVYSTTVAGTPTAKEVTSIERDFEFTGDLLRYVLSKAAMGQPHQHHLAATLRRT